MAGVGPRQRIANSIITDNEGGGFHFSQVGEFNPVIMVESNRIQRCGLKLLNMTSPPVIYGYVQNARLATIANNYIVGNAGGVEINTTAMSRSASIYLNITNNIINYNSHGEPLHIEGSIGGYPVIYCKFINACEGFIWQNSRPSL